MGIFDWVSRLLKPKREVDTFIREVPRQENPVHKSEQESLDQAYDRAYEQAQGIWKEEAVAAGEPDANFRPKEIHETLGQDITDSASKIWEKTQQVATDLGEKISHTGEDLFEKAKEVSNQAMNQVLDKTGELLEKANQKINEISKKAEQEAAEEKAKESDFRPHDVGKTVFETRDDFFEKAKKFAEGNYHNQPEPTPENPVPAAKGTDRKDLPELEFRPKPEEPPAGDTGKPRKTDGIEEAEITEG